MVSSQSTTGSNGEKERSSWNCVLAVEEVSRREYLLSNKDMWDKGCRGAKKRAGADRIGSKLDSGQATNPVLGLKGVGQIQYL